MQWACTFSPVPPPGLCCEMFSISPLEPAGLPGIADASDTTNIVILTSALLSSLWKVYKDKSQDCKRSQDLFLTRKNISFVLV